MTEVPDRPFWLWPNLLSLDAPIVALVWQDFVSRCFYVPLFAPGRLVLGFTVWAIYIVDRLLDVRTPATGEEFARHRFYRAHRKLATVALAVIVGVDLLTLTLYLRPAVFRNGLSVAFAAVAYLSIFTSVGSRYAVLKTSCVAILFTAGVFLVAWTRTPEPARTLFWSAASFALLCKVNLVLIENLERNRPMRALVSATTVLGIVCAAVGQSRWYYGIALSCVAHLVLSQRGRKVSVDARRVLADAVLLAPLLLH